MARHPHNCACVQCLDNEALLDPSTTTRKAKKPLCASVNRCFLCLSVANMLLLLVALALIALILFVLNVITDDYLNTVHEIGDMINKTMDTMHEMMPAKDDAPPNLKA